MHLQEITSNQIAASTNQAATPSRLGRFGRITMGWCARSPRIGEGAVKCHGRRKKSVTVTVSVRCMSARLILDNHKGNENKNKLTFLSLSMFIIIITPRIIIHL